ncbi:DNA glycosylase AlkZ-like family protein [Microbacterium aoyamense]|nr:crosslink repair DNA glycosylase YcaQ family protein [Microbacterium aoyamense]
MASMDFARALTWRLRRHALDDASAASVADVADRVLAFRAWPTDNADLTVATRLATPSMTALGTALARGDVIRSYAFRGGQYVFTRETGATLLTARTATGVWKTARWQEQGGFALDDWQPLREAVRETLRSGPKTRREISTRLEAIPALRHLAPAARGAGADSLYKPLHWWGDICFGPSIDGEAAFQLVIPALESIDLDDAGRRAVRAYLHAYGPATEANLAYWLTDGLGVPRKRVQSWVADLADEVESFDLVGTPALVLRVDADDIAAAAPSDAVRLLPAYDPWVFGPGTADATIVPPARRSLISNGANIVIASGVVVGTWKMRADVVTIDAFAELDDRALRDEVARLAGTRGEHLELTRAH